MPCTAENNFVPEPPNEHVDLVYLCFPNNPTGAVAIARAARGAGSITRASMKRFFCSTRLRSVYQRSTLISILSLEGRGGREAPGKGERRDSAFHFRDRWRARMCSRTAQLFQNRRIHRGSLWLHRHAEDVAGANRIGKTTSAPSACGIAAGARSQTASVTRCNAQRKRCIRRRAGNNVPH